MHSCSWSTSSGPNHATFDIIKLIKGFNYISHRKNGVSEQSDQRLKENMNDSSITPHGGLQIFHKLTYNSILLEWA